MATRNLGFRVWDNRLNKFVTQACPGLGCPDSGPITISLNGKLGVELEYCCETDLNKHGERYILLQYTESRDKNGKMVCDGDIVKVARTRHWSEERTKGVFTGCMEELGEEVGEVMFLGGQWTISYEHLRYDDTEPFPYYSDIVNCHRMEIIGNKFENPDLLKND